LQQQNKKWDDKLFSWYFQLGSQISFVKQATWYMNDIVLTLDLTHIQVVL